MSKTVITGWIMAVFGFLGTVGVDLPLDVIETLLNKISGDAMELFTIIAGALMVWLRTVTDSPLAKGLKGWFGAKE